MNDTVYPEGVSVILCCYNSAARLPETLAHLFAQQDTEGIPWEILVVDNASSDGTAQAAERLFAQHPEIPARVVYEPRPGQTYARWRGYEEARYEYLSYIDDDNWVNLRWIATVMEIMSMHCDVGACGGWGEAACEVQPPAWFEAQQRKYAVGLPRDQAGDITTERMILRGAGLTVRRAAMVRLQAVGYRSLLSGRSGKSLSSGDDTELNMALRLSGWRLWYDPRLTFQHFIPAFRLNWAYLSRITRYFGASSVPMEAYQYAFNPALAGQLPPAWVPEALRLALKLMRRPGLLAQALCYGGQGDDAVLEAQRKIGRLGQLLKMRGERARMIEQVRGAAWCARTTATRPETTDA